MDIEKLKQENYPMSRFWLRRVYEQEPRPLEPCKTMEDVHYVKKSRYDDCGDINHPKFGKLRLSRSILEDNNYLRSCLVSCEKMPNEIMGMQFEFVD